MTCDIRAIVKQDYEKACPRLIIVKSKMDIKL